MTQAPRYAPDPTALARELEIQDADVLLVIDARGGVKCVPFRESATCIP